MSLKVEHISFGYKGRSKADGTKQVLQDFSAEFPAGKITALTGNNGAGKTTLARIIMGILKQDQGHILLDGEPIDQLTMAQRGMRIGYVMQNPARQIFSVTVEEEMQYGLRNLSLPEEEIARRTTEYLQLFGLEQYRESFPVLLRHGETQRLVLAAILAMKPGYLILDEPTASLDLKRRKTLGDFLKQLDCGIIIISHDQTFIEATCDGQIRMEACHERS
ncbi:MAG: ABC transporter ATP-binding protein [Bacillota bacterium]|nr:ABC transporter ATP-binding protein [Bacillota bacterium]